MACNEDIIIQKNSQLKSLTSLIAMVGRFIPVWFFSRFNSIWVIFQVVSCQRYYKIPARLHILLS